MRVPEVTYIRSSINDTEPTTFFLDIVAPLPTDANGKYTVLMMCLDSHRFTDQYMSEHLVCICTDRASGIRQTCWCSNSDKEQISKNRWMALPEPSTRDLHP